MKPQAPHYFALIIAILIFAASVFAYIFIYHSVTVQTGKTAQAIQNVHTQQMTATNEQKLNDLLNTTENQRLTLGTFMLSSNATVQFIEKVESVGAQSGSKVLLVSISADTDILHAHVSAVGGWPNVMRAIHIVESLPYSIIIDNVRVGGDDSGKWTVGFDIAVTLAPAGQTSQ